jgi:peptidase S41-like protein/PDZ domain-containing protein
MKAPHVLLMLAACASIAPAQLSIDQKIADFQNLAGVFSKNYGPYEWKRDTQAFDLMQIGPWMDRIKATTNDLDFYEVMVDYVAHLNDAHDNYNLPSSFQASLGFTVDIYDGKVLVDSINRTRLPAATYPFQIGDELVSVDGQTAENLVQAYSKYSIFANPLSTRRGAAARITTRPQSRMPHAVDVGDNAAVVIRGQDGTDKTYTIPWLKTGLPLRKVGPVPTPRAASAEIEYQPNGGADYLEPLRRLQNCMIPDTNAVLNFGGFGPIFSFPAGFQIRLGTRATDQFVSGTFRSGPYNIGFIRIPNYAPSDTNAALNQFAGEMVFFQGATDGLIIDEMRNPGGSVVYANQIAQLVIPYRFRSIPFEVRATPFWIESISSSLTSAKAQGAPDWVIAQLGSILDQLKQANSENRGRTGPIPLGYTSIDLDPLTDTRGNQLAYTKPLMVLIDEFSASGGDYFPATIQDNNRGILFGMRTMGAGGNVNAYFAGLYSEGITTLTESLMVRKNPTVTTDYPAAPYVENIGVRPDIVQDYMTKDNLLRGGRAFVDAFSAAMVDWITKNR